MNLCKVMDDYILLRKGGLCISHECLAGDQGNLFIICVSSICQVILMLCLLADQYECVFICS